MISNHITRARIGKAKGTGRINTSAQSLIHTVMTMFTTRKHKLRAAKQAHQMVAGPERLTKPPYTPSCDTKTPEI
jgi:hypothetical protein